MDYRAIYAYPWDLADEGVDAVVQCVRALGLNTITVAGAYHAGKFLRPHGQNGRVYFPEDGTVYFAADVQRYGAIAPVVSRVTRERDVLRELAGDARVATHVWLVLLHNTRLGERHPDATVSNAFGDRYVYSLCPSAPDVREYAIALCRDVTDHYPVAGIILETPGFLPYAHGFHHEFAMVPPSRWLDLRLGLCFCAHCVRGAEAAGIDARALQARIRADIDAGLSGDLAIPEDVADASWIADLVADDVLSAFLRFRCGVVTALVRGIRAAVRPDADVAVIPTVARPTSAAWYEGSDLHALASVVGTVEAALYEPSADRLRADISDTQRRMRGAGTLRGILRPAFPDLQTRGELMAAVRALREAGASGIAFYNYGHVGRRNLAWIADAMQAWHG